MTTAEWKKGHSAEQIRQVIAEGSKKNTKMKAFKDKLTPEQIDALVKHIQAMK
ncbi:MAG TPA: cytochrome c [Myxococcaceae bacterium]|nr:cytochrome c [Myxococcaceae bacterium]